MRITVSLIILLLSAPVLSCDLIQGKFNSVSETHWNFELKVSGSNATLIHKNYNTGKGNLRVDETVQYQGNCKKTDSGYKLTFLNKIIDVKYFNKLSHKSFGKDSTSPGIVGNFFNDRSIELWRDIHVTHAE